MKPEDIEALFEKTKDDIVNNKNKPQVIIKDGVEYIMLQGEDHRVGDVICPACFCTWPKSCSCGGCKHTSFLEEDQDGYSLAYLCDKCGSTDYES
jgi:hypothetical protein